MQNKEDRTVSYDDRAVQYAEKYGIITYKVDGKFLIFNRNVHDKNFISGKWVDKPYTIQTKVDLDTYEYIQKKLMKLQKNGWDNAH